MLLSERQAVGRARERLAELLGVASSDSELRRLPERSQADAVIDVGERTFVIECKGSGALAQVSIAARQAQKAALAFGEGAIPLIVVPFMGPVGREHCERSGVGWIDLSGNARIVAPGVHVRVDGQPNRFKHPGRPSSAFAPKSARIARWLLMHPGQSMTQREIAHATEMDEGFTSRIVGKLEDDGLIVRRVDGVIQVPDPALLLDAWREGYDFSKHVILRGHVASRSGDALLRQLSEDLRARECPYAATGLGAAWLLSRFAAFRIVTFYVSEEPPQDLLEEVGFREESPGANVWLVVPNDEGVFHGSSEHAGVRCVHPVQAYLDLLAHPERAAEAAERLRSELLPRKADA